MLNQKKRNESCILQKRVSITIFGKNHFFSGWMRWKSIAVRCGVKLAREYMQYLKDENEKLREENQLKNSYLKKMKITNK